MNVTWLGQSGYLMESRGERLLIDPFYSDIVEQKQGLKRLMEAPVPITDLRPDLIFITHDHLDHFDPIALPVIHQTYPRARIIGPQSVMKKARELDFDESALVPLPVGSAYQAGAFRLRALPAYHGDPLAVGLFIHGQDKAIFYSGDTLLTDTYLDDIQAVCPASIDIAFIVINGRLGNMNLAEAVRVASALRPALAIPMHYGMFAENTADPLEFARNCHQNGIKTQLMPPGVPVNF
ncbi:MULTISPECIES: MBL fold metallo-hydrolase [Spirosoma]|uniref:MBL fold metallo-hydrolase n=1 Tax=Spirosoma sordidisoli TaxID=2502893 RepID=A0A4Q2UL06_9BACT|nr:MULTISPECIES: MBL fold metallo-hydrolase [Spirosoma]RYC69382.1 MBL fold metallo-hydrolase [Spirosoma sordidisoli]